jgi:hypothetical protein
MESSQLESVGLLRAGDGRDASSSKDDLQLMPVSTEEKAGESDRDIQTASSIIRPSQIISPRETAPLPPPPSQSYLIQPSSKPRESRSMREPKSSKR